MNPEDLNSKEDDGKVLRDSGIGDLISSMRCVNCKYYLRNEFKCRLKEESVEKFNPEDSCASFDELDSKNILNEIYQNIKDILKNYMDMKEENYDIIALWIIGTWLHKHFPSYPYLFVNAMKGSGKTRLLKLIKTLSWKGDMLASLSEAVLFRTEGTLCIDEFEGIHGKDKNALRELLNTAYKKGGKVKRMRKKKTIEGEQQVVEEFNTYRPIIMANIWGMEEVLGDRCLNIILEKSNNNRITRMIEDFETSPEIITTLSLITSNLGFIAPNDVFSVVICNYTPQKNIYREWNTYINNTTHNYTTTQTTLNNNTTLFKKIYDTKVNGRNLELTFPLLLIADEIGILDRVIEIIKKIVDERKEDDIIESRDVMLYSFVSSQDNSWYKIKELTNLFRQKINADEEDTWLNTKWMGRALKRLNLIGQKRRVGEGVEVILNFEKAKEKMNIFR